MAKPCGTPTLIAARGTGPAPTDIDVPTGLNSSASTDIGTRLVSYTTAAGETLIAASSDRGATWTVVYRTTQSGLTALARIPNVGLIVSGPQPGHGLLSADDGLTWTPLRT